MAGLNISDKVERVVVGDSTSDEDNHPQVALAQAMDVLRVDQGDDGLNPVRGAITAVFILLASFALMRFMVWFISA